MEYQNLTPFPSLSFASIDKEDQQFHVVVLRATYVIQTDGTLRAAVDQKPILMEDVYYGELNHSSVKQESDLAPFKPKCDVIVSGTAHAPGRQPSRRFAAGIRISRADQTIVDKKVSITGPRFWKKRFLRGWTLARPEPILSLPLRYEFAYGGECRLESDDPEKTPVAHTCCEANPLGMGYAEPRHLKAKKIKRWRAPQIESPDDPIRLFHKTYTPQGLGVVCKAWQSRLRLAGSYDSSWLNSRHPYLPKDYNASYWNGAHPDLQAPWLKGDELIELTNLTPEGWLTFRLPGHFPYALVYYAAGPIVPRPMLLDTLFIEPDASVCSLAWRATIPVRPEVTHIESRMVLPEQKIVQEQLAALIEAAHE